MDRELATLTTLARELDGLPPKLASELLHYPVHAH